MAQIRKGTEVTWKWGRGWASGTVQETYDHPIEKTLSGTAVSRHGDPRNRALLIKQEDGQRVLKLESEVQTHDG